MVGSAFLPRPGDCGVYRFLSKLHRFVQFAPRTGTALPELAGAGLPDAVVGPDQAELQARLKQQHELTAAQDERLRVRNLQFDMTINNMSLGLCFFDGSQRLILCNNRYIEMYDLDPARVVPGTTLQEIVDLRFAAGSFPQMSKTEYLVWRDSIAVADKPTDSVVKLKNGRTVQIRHPPMPDLGWVVTHQDVTEAIRAEARISHLALHDALTDLPNRVLFQEKLAEALLRVPRGDNVAVLCLDLDRFKAVNDTLGHAIGDELLKAAADRLRGCLRDTDMVARLGGDEFAIIQPFGEQPTGATSLASRIIDSLSAPYTIASHEIVIGTSTGVSKGPIDRIAAGQVLKNAVLATLRSQYGHPGVLGSRKMAEPDQDRGQSVAGAVQERQARLRRDRRARRIRSLAAAARARDHRNRHAA